MSWKKILWTNVEETNKLKVELHVTVDLSANNYLKKIY